MRIFQLATAAAVAAFVSINLGAPALEALETVRAVLEGVA